MDSGGNAPMLVRFAATNFRSINERQELSLVPSAFYKDHREVLVPCDAVPMRSLLPAAVIYGANAAGKSNVINAVRFLRGAVEASQIEAKPDAGVPRQPFALNEEGVKTPTVIEVEFVTDGVRYQYGFEAV